MAFEPNKDNEGGFAALLRTEWNQFRSVRRWMIGMVIAAPLPCCPGR
ncbi:hypothetical protein LJK88_38750 [Paenibacillus sp. P26]|nr:hypothetical protein LJK88_38750 [Paenibacillus sp. P26]